MNCFPSSAFNFELACEVLSSFALMIHRPPRLRPCDGDLDRHESWAFRDLSLIPAVGGADNDWLRAYLKCVLQQLCSRQYHRLLVFSSLLSLLPTVSFTDGD